MTRAEEMKARDARIKAEYHATVLGSSNDYRVEVSGLYGWSNLKWSFSNLKDAKAYVEKEVKGSARIVKSTMIDAHTMNTEVVYVKETK